MVHQEGQSFVEVRIREAMEVIQNQGEIGRGPLDRIDQQRQDNLLVRRLRSPQPSEGLSAETWVQSLDSGYRVGPEPDRVVVVFIQRQPRYRLPALRSPLSQEGCFAKAGWGRDERQWPGQP